eukprot:12853931-Ditylum_brightwellii.AAC.1
MFLMVSSTVTWLSKSAFAALYWRRPALVQLLIVDIVAYSDAFMTRPMCPLFPPPSVVATFAAFA